MNNSQKIPFNSEPNRVVAVIANSNNGLSVTLAKQNNFNFGKPQPKHKGGNFCSRSCDNVAQTCRHAEQCRSQGRILTGHSNQQGANGSVSSLGTQSLRVSPSRHNRSNHQNPNFKSGNANPYMKDLQYSEEFAASLRQYPNLVPADFIERLLTQTQSKYTKRSRSAQAKNARFLSRQETKTQHNKATSNKMDRSTSTSNDLSPKVSNNSIRSQRRFRRWSPPANFSFTYERQTSSPTRSESSNGLERLSSEMGMASYDYLNADQCNAQRVDVRYLSEVTKYVTDRLRLLSRRDSDQSCPRIRERYSQHRRMHHNDDSMIAKSKKLRNTEVHMNVVQTSETPRKYRASKSLVSYPDRVKHHHFPTVDLSGMSADMEKQVSNFEFNNENSANVSTNSDILNSIGLDTSVNEAVNDWLKEVPIHASYTGKEKKIRESIVSRLKRELQSHLGDKELCKVDIMKCLNDLPMWLPTNKVDQHEFKNNLLLDMLTKLDNILVNIDIFDVVVRKWLERVPLKTDGLNMNRIVEKITRRLKSVEFTATTDELKNSYANSALEVLQFLPIECNDTVKKTLADTIADTFIKIPSCLIEYSKTFTSFCIINDEVLDEIIRNWIKFVPFRFEDPAEATGVVQELKETLLDVVLTSSDNDLKLSLKKIILSFLEAVDCSDGEKSVLADKLAEKISLLPPSTVDNLKKTGAEAQVNYTIENKSAMDDAICNESTSNIKELISKESPISELSNFLKKYTRNDIVKLGLIVRLIKESKKLHNVDVENIFQDWCSINKGEIIESNPLENFTEMSVNSNTTPEKIHQTTSPVFEEKPYIFDTFTVNSKISSSEAKNMKGSFRNTKQEELSTLSEKSLEEEILEQQTTVQDYCLSQNEFECSDTKNEPTAKEQNEITELSGPSKDPEYSCAESEREEKLTGLSSATNEGQADDSSFTVLRSKIKSILSESRLDKKTKEILEETLTEEVQTKLMDFITCIPKVALQKQLQEMGGLSKKEAENIVTKAIDDARSTLKYPFSRHLKKKPNYTVEVLSLTNFSRMKSSTPKNSQELANRTSNPKSFERDGDDLKTDTTDIQSQNTSAFLEENLSAALSDWLKQLPLYQIASSEDKRQMDLKATQMAKDLKIAISQANLSTESDPEKVFLEEIVQKLSSVFDVYQDLCDNNDFMNNTGKILLTDLKQQQIFEDLSGRSRMSIVDPLTITIDDWLKALGVSENTNDDIKRNFISQLKEIRAQNHPSSPNHVNKIKEASITFLKAAMNLEDPLESSDETYINESVQNLAKLLQGVPIRQTSKNKPDLSRILPYKSPNDTLYEYIENWCKNLPLTGEPDEINMIVKDLSSKLVNKVGELNINPDVFYDDPIYEDSLQDEFNKLLSEIPGNPELDKYLPALKKDLISKVMDARKMICYELAGKAYKQELRYKISTSLPLRDALTSEQNASLELLKDKVADAFINLQYASPLTPCARNKYKRKIWDEIDKFCEVVFCSNACAQIDSDRLKQDLYNALANVPVPKDDSMKSEVEQVRIRDIIYDWMQYIPLRQESSADTLHRYKLAVVLAKRIHTFEIENKYNPSVEYEAKMSEEIIKFLNKIRLSYVDDDPDLIPELVKKLTDELLNTKQSRKFISYQRSHNLSDTCVRNEFPCTISLEDQQHLKRIRKKHNPCLKKNKVVCTSSKVSGCQKNDFGTQCWLPHQTNANVKHVSSQCSYKQNMSSMTSKMTHISPIVSVHEYHWEDTMLRPRASTHGVQTCSYPTGHSFDPDNYSLPPCDSYTTQTDICTTPGRYRHRNTQRDNLTSTRPSPYLGTCPTGRQASSCSYRLPVPLKEVSCQKGLSYLIDDEAENEDDLVPSKYCVETRPKIRGVTSRASISGRLRGMNIDNDEPMYRRPIFGSRNGWRPERNKPRCVRADDGYDYTGRQVSRVSPVGCMKAEKNLMINKCQCKDRVVLNYGQPGRQIDMCRDCGRTCPHPSCLTFK